MNKYVLKYSVLKNTDFERNVSMAMVIPFKGLRYNMNKFTNLDDVTAPPYDMISSEQQQELYDKSEYNIVRVDYGMEYDSDNKTENKYKRSMECLKDWLDNEILVCEDKPAFYIYEQIFSLGNEEPSHSLKGIIGLVKIEDASKKIIKPHEEIIEKDKDDRLELLSSTRANTSPIYSLFADEDKVMSDMIDCLTDREPDVAFISSENITQNIWIITDEAETEKITEFFSDKEIYIADGHHRYEAALEYRDKCRVEEKTDVLKDFDFTMMALVSIDDSGLFLYPRHRLVRGVENFDEMLTVGLLTEDFSVSKIYFTEGDYASIITDRLANTVDETLIGFYTGNNYYYLLNLKNTKTIDDAISDKSDAYKHLDITVLNKMILENCLRINEDNIRNQKDVVYTRDARKAIEDVKAGKFDCVFFVNPTKVTQIKEIADNEEKMPQKSSCFWPKMLTGTVLNKFDK